MNENVDDEVRELQLKGKGVAILIPCYNEEMTIGKVIDDFSSALPLSDVYVYDNNSSDATAKIAEEHGAVVKRHLTQGKGSTVRQMIRDINADYYIMVDGDDTYPAESSIELLRPLIDGVADTAVGDRLSNNSYLRENDRAFHGAGNKLVKYLIRLMYGFQYNDVMTGYRAFTRLFADNLPIMRDGFEIETELSIHSVDKRWRIYQIPIQYRNRPDGSESKLSTFSDGWKVLRTILSLFKDYKPMTLFGILTTLCFIIAVIIGIPIVSFYADTGLVQKIPSVMVCAGFGIAGLLFLCCGLILDTSVKNSRKSYETHVLEMIRKG